MALHLTYGVSIILILYSCTSLIMAQYDYVADPTFDEKDLSGASQVYPAQCAALRNNGYVIIKGRPCKIKERSISKIGGQAMINIEGIDVFNNKLCKHTCPFTQNIDVPVVKHQDYQVIDISADGYLSLMDNGGDVREDIRVPEGDLGTAITNRFYDGEDIVATVRQANGEEHAVDVKRNTI